MVATPRSRRVPSLKLGNESPRWRTLLAALAVAIAIGLAAFALWRWLSATGAISVTGATVVGEAQGTLTIVNGRGNAICLTPTNGAEQLCGGLFLPSGEALPAVGSEIGVWIVRIPYPNGTAEDDLILKPRGDPGT